MLATPHLRIRSAMLLGAAMLVCACGGGGTAASEGEAARATTATGPMTEPDAADDVTPVAVAPGPGALKVRRAQEPLLVAYQPVTDYASTVVAADGLSTLELSRPGELARVAAEMLRRSRASRSAILALRRRSIDPDLQRLLIATLDGRIDAMRLLIRSEQASDTDAAVSRQLRVRYLDAWQGSVGAARGATNQMQAQRTSVGLAAAPEDSIR